MTRFQLQILLWRTLNITEGISWCTIGQNISWFSQVFLCPITSGILPRTVLVISNILLEIEPRIILLVLEVWYSSDNWKTFWIRPSYFQGSPSWTHPSLQGNYQVIKAVIYPGTFQLFYQFSEIVFFLIFFCMFFIKSLAYKENPRIWGILTKFQESIFTSVESLQVFAMYIPKFSLWVSLGSKSHKKNQWFAQY